MSYIEESPQPRVTWPCLDVVQPVPIMTDTHMNDAEKSARRREQNRIAQRNHRQRRRDGQSTRGRTSIDEPSSNLAIDDMYLSLAEEVTKSSQPTGQPMTMITTDDSGLDGNSFVQDYSEFLNGFPIEFQPDADPLLQLSAAAHPPLQHQSENGSASGRSASMQHHQRRRPSAPHHDKQPFDTRPDKRPRFGSITSSERSYRDVPFSTLQISAIQDGSQASSFTSHDQHGMRTPSSQSGDSEAGSNVTKAAGSKRHPNGRISQNSSHCETVRRSPSNLMMTPSSASSGERTGSTKASRGQTTLHLAAAQGSVPLVRMLLDRGASLSQSDTDGLNAMHHAIRGGHLSVVNALIDEGAAFEQVDHCGRTALHYAIEQRQDRIAMKLIHAGADIDAAIT